MMHAFLNATNDRPQSRDDRFPISSDTPANAGLYGPPATLEGRAEGLQIAAEYIAALGEAVQAAVNDHNPALAQSLLNLLGCQARLVGDIGAAMEADQLATIAGIAAA